MLKSPSVFVYVVDRDYGFAPNPFHGTCTLATCKPKIRNVAEEGDWVVGVGGGRLDAQGRCIFAMQVTQKMTYDDYWEHSDYQTKKPVRNGSKVSMVGDNIYHKDKINQEWVQANSHHSFDDGTPNPANVKNDTLSEFVLISDHFYYFGSCAPKIPHSILEKLNYKNVRNHRRYPIEQGLPLINWLETGYHSNLNMITEDPFDFESSHERYSP